MSRYGCNPPTGRKPIVYIVLAIIAAILGAINEVVGIVFFGFFMVFGLGNKLKDIRSFVFEYYV